jgi:OmpA-OmpF porin, OOP family
MPVKITLLSTVCAIALAGTAQAKGWYIGLEAGASSVADTDADFRSTSAGLTTFAYEPVGRFDVGWVVVATMGYALHGWRIEGELAWRSNDKDQFTIPALPSTGSLDELTAMYNMTYELPLGSGLGVSFGGGAGLDYAMLDIAGLDDADLNIALQGIAGINYAIGANTELTLAYRYLVVLDPEFEERSDPGTVIRFENLTKHALTLGVRYTYAP